ncbi:uncharacterized protein V1516DRAFT_71389 [Lipomyces oligophaga]|uniref:uncharacterized protein n=1 Tax=Lipomyces oligophaga TaxID=45792 RepID=UPI0034CE5588
MPAKVLARRMNSATEPEGRPPSSFSSAPSATGSAPMSITISAPPPLPEQSTTPSSGIFSFSSTSSLKQFPFPSRSPSRSGRPSSRFRSYSNSTDAPSRSRSVDSSAVSNTSSTTGSFFSRFRRSSASTTGSDTPTTPVEKPDESYSTMATSLPTIPPTPPSNSSKQLPKAFTRRRARTLETIPQNAAAHHHGRYLHRVHHSSAGTSASSSSRRPSIISSLQDSRHSSSNDNVSIRSSHSASGTMGGTGNGHSGFSGNLFGLHRRAIPDLARSRVTFEEPNHRLHESMSSNSLRYSSPSIGLDDNSLLPVSELSASVHRPRSLISTLSESDIRSSNDGDDARYLLSAPLSPRNTDMQPIFNSSSRPTSPTPSSSSSSVSSYQPLTRWRRRFTSVFNSGSSPSKEDRYQSGINPASSSPNDSDLNISLPFSSASNSNAYATFSGQASPTHLARSLSSLSHSNSFTALSSVSANRSRSQTMSSVEQDKRIRKELPLQLNQLANMLSIRFRSGSEPSFTEPKSKQSLSSPRTPRTPDPLAVTSLLENALPDYEDENETPSEYLKRIDRVVNKSYIALLLSKHDEPFYLYVLSLFCARFDLVDIPIDIALRKFLLVVKLPKETQQIDRVLDAFAARYHYCNPEIFFSKEEAYITTFSLMMLHTDVFNKNNKHKMQRADYVRNTDVHGLSGDVLEYLYDNITYVPFVHNEDDEDAGGDAISPSDKLKEQPMLARSRKSLVNLTRQNRDPIDPYQYISEDRLAELRAPVSEIINLEDPFSYSGTAPQFDVKILHTHFINSPILQISTSRSRPSTIHGVQDFSSSKSEPTVHLIKIAKIGVLNSIERKKKKSTRGSARQWGVILTLSHIYLFRDVSWIRGLMDQLIASAVVNERTRNGIQDVPLVFYPPIQGFHADEVLSTNDMIALFDSSYTARKNAFVIFSKAGIQDWFLAENQIEMNDWIAKVNYASTLNTSKAKLQGVELQENGDPLVRHLVDSLNPPSPRPGQYPVASTASGTFNALPSPRSIPDLSQSERASALFSSLFYDSGSILSHVSDCSNDVSVDRSTIEFALQVSQGRYKVLDEKVQELQLELYSQKQELDAENRSAKHLSILTPLMQRTRESLVAAALNISVKIDWLRIDVMRSRCYREILVKEIDSERNVIALLDSKLKSLATTEATHISDNGEKSEALSSMEGLALAFDNSNII